MPLERRQIAVPRQLTADTAVEIIVDCVFALQELGASTEDILRFCRAATERDQARLLEVLGGRFDLVFESDGEAGAQGFQA